MTNQADRIEALLTEVNAKLDLWLAGQKRTKKPANKREPTSIVKITMDTLEQVRGYVSTQYPAEAKAIKEMEEMGYTSQNILECHKFYKQDKFWHDKPLPTMSIKAMIGQWKKNQQPIEDEQDKYDNQNLPPRRERT